MIFLQTWSNFEEIWWTGLDSGEINAVQCTQKLNVSWLLGMYYPDKELFIMPLKLSAKYVGYHF